MSQTKSATNFALSDEELLRRTRRRSATFEKLLDGKTAEFESPKDALYAGSVLLAWEQRGYRDREQIVRIVGRLPLDTDVVAVELDSIVGRAINTVEAVYDREPTSELDRLIQELSALSLDEQRRILQKRGYTWPRTDDVHQRLRNAVFGSMEQGECAVLVAPTAAGKTAIAVTTRWLEHQSITGGEPVILLVETKTAREEAKQRAENAGLNVAILESYTVCPVANGDYDDEIWIEDIPASQWFEDEISTRGIRAGEAHERAEWLYDGELPCCAGEITCELSEQWTHIPRHDNYDAPVHDLIIATDAFAHVPSIRENTNIIHDEQPTYTIDFDTNPYLHQQRIQEMVGSFLTEVDAPVTQWESFVHYAREGTADERAAITSAIRTTPSDDWYHYGEGAHRLAPRLTRVLWQAFGNSAGPHGRSTATIEYEPVRFDGTDDDPAGINRLSVVVDDQNTVRTIRQVPDFSICRSVVGLDAWPCYPLWERNIRPGIRLNRVLDAEERQLWRLFERGLAVVRVGEATRPMTTGENFRVQHARIIIETLSHRFPDRFSTIGTPSSIEGRIETIMTEVGIDDPETMHHGEQKSNNTFKDELVGLLYGCIDPGDGPILDLLAECGYSARPKYRGHDIPCDKCGTTGGNGCNRCRCEQCSGNGCSACHEIGRQRAFGRGFVGPDADKATTFLESVRECNNAQMVGRWGREPDENAAVYACTTALPDELVDFEVPGVVWTYGEKQQAIIEELLERERATIREIQEAIEAADTDMTVSREHVWKTLKKQVSHGNAVKHDGEGAYNADIYEWTGPEFVSRNGIADLGDEFC
ncbi:hypothetical protein [Halorussus salinisoli]|uniref:hypothetical protein n=1 Tax=Halorussus salinisoli TaxID=2558242 RepID=UPI0010C1C14E|nr:hypothetical protein [Halorussus salinisoli]